MRMVAWVEGRKSPYTPSIRPYTSEYTARILLQYFKYNDKYLKMCGLPHTGVGVWNWLYGFLTPPYFQGAKLIFSYPMGTRND